MPSAKSVLCATTMVDGHCLEALPLIDVDMAKTGVKVEDGDEKYNTV